MRSVLRIKRVIVLLPWGTTLDIGISEYIITGTSPDVTFHVSLRKLFGGGPSCP